MPIEMHEERDIKKMCEETDRAILHLIVQTMTMACEVKVKSLHSHVFHRIEIRSCGVEV